MFLDYLYHRNLATRVGFHYGGTQKLAYFLNSIRKNCMYFDRLRKTGILSDTKILYFEGRNMAHTYKLQSYGH